MRSTFRSSCPARRLSTLAVSFATIAVALLALAPAANATLFNVQLPGTTAYDGWSGLTNLTYGPGAGFPTHPGSAPWPSAVASNQTGSTATGALSKVAGDGYFASAGLYTSTNGGTYSVSQSAPITGLKTAVFEADTGIGVGGDFLSTPTLNYNGGSQGLAPVKTILAGTYQTGGGNPTDHNIWIYQWDTSSLGAITSIDVSFVTHPHAQVFEMALRQGDTFQTVPEPGSLALGLIGAVGGMFLLLRRRKAAAAA